ncbi:MAG TPA: phosphohydrolase, partial [Chitinophaga sp.]
AHPHTLLEEILCDADTYHLGTADFQAEDQRVKTELELRFHQTIPHWPEKTYAFLQSHRYFTTYAQTHLQPVKLQHMQQLLQQQKG